VGGGGGGQALFNPKKILEEIKREGHKNLTNRLQRSLIVVFYINN